MHAMHIIIIMYIHVYKYYILVFSSAYHVIYKATIVRLSIFIHTDILVPVIEYVLVVILSEW